MNKSLYTALFFMSAFSALNASDCEEEKEKYEKLLGQASFGCELYYRCTSYYDKNKPPFVSSDQKCNYSVCSRYLLPRDLAESALKECLAKAKK